MALQRDWLPGLVTTLLFLLLSGTAVLRGSEWAAYHAIVAGRIRGGSSSQVVIVSAGDTATPDDYSRVVEKLAHSRVKYIGVIPPRSFAESTRFLRTAANLSSGGRGNRTLLSRLGEALGPDHLVRAMKEAGNVGLAIPFDGVRSEGATAKDAMPNEPRLLLTDATSPDRHAGEMLGRLLTRPSGPTGTPRALPAALFDATAGVGYVQPVNLDAAGGSRLALVHEFKTGWLPSFALLVAAGSEGVMPAGIRVEPEHRISFGNKRVNAGSRWQIQPIAGRSAPTVYPLADVLSGHVKTTELAGHTAIVGATGADGPSPFILADEVSSLLDGSYNIQPAWTIALRLLTFLIVGAYLMWLLPRLGSVTAYSLTFVLLVVLFNAEYVFLSSRGVWVPLVVPALALIIGHAVWLALTFWGGRSRQLAVELSETNRLLGQVYQTQGRLDVALERYLRCRPSRALLEQLYTLGQDYERRHQFAKARQVFGHIRKLAPGFGDIAARLQRIAARERQYVPSRPPRGIASVPGSAVSPEPGSPQAAVLGRYEVVREIGRGSMGIVYLGKDQRIGRPVAIKTMALADEFQGSNLIDIRKRFFREAETAGRLSHPNIVTIYDVGEDQNLAFIAMDYLPSGSLQEYATAGRLLPLDEVFAIIMKVGEALQYAHSKMVVHRDIKPANIIYDRKTGRIKVTDFGVACLTDASTTRTGTILGSPSYMSPEQLSGKHVDGRSDLFSLGVTLYQLVRGELPFTGASLATLMYKIANEPHPDVRSLRPDLPACLSVIIDRALQKEPAGRYQSAREMVDALKSCRLEIARRPLSR